MLPITLERFLEQREKTPKRRIFAKHSGVQKNKNRPSFSVKFYESVGPIYEAMTRSSLQYSYQFDNFWHFLNSETEIQATEKWTQAQGNRVFLRDCLSCSIALSLNMKEVETGERTECGELEYRAKSHECEVSTNALVDLLSATIKELPLYNNTRLIAAVPARPGKTTRDLPAVLASRLATKLGLTDLTSHFIYGGPKDQLKEMPLAERWVAWEGAKLSLSVAGAAILKGHPVILIDDKYQSGVSANFVAMLLQQNGASDVYGLYAVKTMRDSDNT